MITKDKIAQYLLSRNLDFESVEEFIETVSNIYHGHEASVYDELHTDIQLSGFYWERMLVRLLPYLPKRLRLLDVGCGTGFAAMQVINILRDRIEHLTCVDLSPDMLGRCRINLGATIPNIEYVCGDIQTIVESGNKFDLVITNAVLHHLLDFQSFLEAVSSIVQQNGWYIAGNEPNSRYYGNQILLRWWNHYRTWKRLGRILKPSTYLRRIGIYDSLRNIDDLTNDSLIELGVIRNAFPPGVVAKFVDIHVPPAHSDMSFWGERGFDPVKLVAAHLHDFEIVECITYSHIKDAGVQRDPMWHHIERQLQRQFPFDGADMIFPVHHLPNR